jgi:hypothetical protein
VVSTLAGGVSGTNSAYADASGTNAGFNKPVGVAIDASGNVFVGDVNNNCIRKVTAGGGTRIGPSLFALTVRTLTLKHRCERVGRSFIDVNAPLLRPPSRVFVACVLFRLDFFSSSVFLMLQNDTSSTVVVTKNLTV